MKYIEKWIEFARSNWYILTDWESYYQSDCEIHIEGNSVVISANIWKHWTNEILSEVNVIEIITSKRLIESIARGVNKKIMSQENYSALLKNWLINKWYDWDVYTLQEVNDRFLDDEIDRITTEQAIAIRDNTLDKFITETLWK